MTTGGGEPTPAQSQYPSTPERLETTGGAREDGLSPVLINRQEFIRNYANLVARTWVDESYLELLRANPVDTLARAGMPTIPGAVVRVVEMKLTGQGRIEEQIDRWIEGNRTGLYDLWLSMKPEGVDVAVGGLASVEACCCCTPCCCCT
jgi:hypothetical protein